MNFIDTDVRFILSTSMKVMSFKCQVTSIASDNAKKSAMHTPLTVSVVIIAEMSTFRDIFKWAELTRRYRESQLMNEGRHHVKSNLHLIKYWKNGDEDISSAANAEY